MLGTCSTSGACNILVGACLETLVNFAYWPLTRAKLRKKCTSVNNRCIWLKISGDQGWPWLSRGWIESKIVMLTGSRWASNYYITPVTGSSDQLERRCWNEDHVLAEAGLPRTPVEQPRRTGKKGCDRQKSGGQYVAVFVRSPTPSHTQPLQ